MHIFHNEYDVLSLPDHTIPVLYVSEENFSRRDCEFYHYQYVEKVLLHHNKLSALNPHCIDNTLRSQIASVAF